MTDERKDGYTNRRDYFRLSGREEWHRHRKKWGNLFGTIFAQFDCTMTNILYWQLRMSDGSRGRESSFHWYVEWQVRSCKYFISPIIVINETLLSLFGPDGVWISGIPKGWIILVLMSFTFILFGETFPTTLFVRNLHPGKTDKK